VFLEQGWWPEAADGLEVARVTTLSRQLSQEFVELRAEIQEAWGSLQDYWLLLKKRSGWSEKRTGVRDSWTGSTMATTRTSSDLHKPGATVGEGSTSKESGWAERLLRATKVRDGLVEAMLFKDKSKIAVLVKNLVSLEVDAKMVAITGLHVLLRDQQLVCMADSTTKALMKGRIESWKRDFVREDGRVRASARGHPFGSVNWVEFLTLVDHWESWLKGMDGSVDQGLRQLDARVVTTLYRRAAATLGFHRSHRPELLDSSLPDEAAARGNSAEEAGVSRRAALTAELLNADGALERSALALTPLTDGPRAAELVATRLSLDSVAAADNAWESSAASEGIPASMITSGLWVFVWLGVLFKDAGRVHTVTMGVCVANSGP